MTRRALTLSLALLACAAAARAEDPSAAARVTDHASSCPMHGGAEGPPAAAPAVPGALPASAGQEAFGAMAEIVGILEADAATDWSRVSIARLREHLRDMDEVTLRAEVAERRVEGGFEAVVRGSGRTLEAIRRMVPAHAAMLRRERPWMIEVEELADGLLLTATAGDAREATRLRGLGFFGLLVSGDHHRLHHLAMARGH